MTNESNIKWFPNPIELNLFIQFPVDRIEVFSTIPFAIIINEQNQRCLEFLVFLSLRKKNINYHLLLNEWINISNILRKIHFTNNNYFYYKYSSCLSCGICKLYFIMHMKYYGCWTVIRCLFKCNSDLIEIFKKIFLFNESLILIRPSFN